MKTVSYQKFNLTIPNIKPQTKVQRDPHIVIPRTSENTIILMVTVSMTSGQSETHVCHGKG